jgi:hypothetical protein
MDDEFGSMVEELRWKLRLNSMSDVVHGLLMLGVEAHQADPDRPLPAREKKKGGRPTGSR